MLATAAVYGGGFPGAATGCEAAGQCPNTSAHTWGQYSPFSVPSAMDATTPRGCRLTFGLVLSRHGSRYPTAAKAKAYRSLLGRV